LDNWEFHGWLILLHPRPSSDESHWHDWLNCLMVIRGVVLLYIISYISYIYIFIIYIYVYHIYLLGTFGDRCGLSVSGHRTFARSMVLGWPIQTMQSAEARGYGWSKLSWILFTLQKSLRW
jgi:hypothetical protein